MRISNGYRFLDPLDRIRGRKSPKSENPTGPQNRASKESGARLDGARVMQGEPSRAPPVPPKPPAIAPQREHDSSDSALLSPDERAALITRLDSKPTKADWDLWSRDLDARLAR